jgi:hypothetical protein
MALFYACCTFLLQALEHTWKESLSAFHIVKDLLLLMGLSLEIRIDEKSDIDRFRLHAAYYKKCLIFSLYMKI